MSVFRVPKGVIHFSIVIFLVSAVFQAFADKEDASHKDLDAVRALEREYYLEGCAAPRSCKGLPLSWSRADAPQMNKELRKFASGKKDSDAVLRAKALMGGVLRMQGDLDKALDLLSPYSEFDKISSKSTYQYKSSHLACFLELAHAKASMSLCRRDGRPAQALDTEKIAPQFSAASLREAMKMLDYAERNAEGVSFATPQEGYNKGLALFKYGDVLFSLSEFRKSESYLNRAKAVLADLMKTEKSKASSEASSLEKLNPDISLLKKRIDALLFSVFIELLEEDYGEAYALYVKARSFHDEASFDAASFVCREVFTKYPETVYEQALRLIYADCLVATGEVKEAKKWLLDMLEKHPKSPYLGEAMMKLGKISLEHDWDCKQSASYYNQALAWFRAERERKDLLDLYTVPEKVATVSASPDPFSSLDEWGRTIYRDEKPMEIITAQNAPWYVSEMEKECLFMVGFFLFVEGKFDEAKECFEMVGAIDKNIAELDSQKLPNVLMRLRGACEDGFMQTSKDVMNKISQKARLVMAYANLLFTMERFAEAKVLYEKLYRDKSSSADEKACALIGTGRSVYYLHDHEKARTFYIEVYEKYRKTASAPHALLLLGYIEDNKGGDSMKFYEKCHDEYPRSHYGECALARCVWVSDVGGEYDMAVRYAKAYFKEYPSGRYCSAIKKTTSKEAYKGKGLNL